MRCLTLVIDRPETAERSGDVEGPRRITCWASMYTGTEVLLSAANEVQFVAVQIADIGAIVVGRITRARAGRTLVKAACCNRRSIRGIHCRP